MLLKSNSEALTIPLSWELEMAEQEEIWWNSEHLSMAQYV